MKRLIKNRIVIATASLIVAGGALQLLYGQRIGGVAAQFAIQYLEGSAQQRRTFSPAVITQGGKTVWLAGQASTEDVNHKPIAGDFDAQVRTDFALLDQTLKRAGGSLQNMVSMTVFLADPRLGPRFVQLRQGLFPDGKYPAAALITVSGFATPGILLEIQGVAVIDQK